MRAPTPKPREAEKIVNVLKVIEKLSPAARGTLFGALMSTYCFGEFDADDVAKCGHTCEVCDEHRSDNCPTDDDPRVA